MCTLDCSFCPCCVLQCAVLFAQHHPVTCSCSGAVIRSSSGLTLTCCHCFQMWILLSVKLMLLGSYLYSPSVYQASASRQVSLLVYSVAYLQCYYHYCHYSLTTVHSYGHSAAAVLAVFCIFSSGRLIFALALCTVFFAFIFSHCSIYLQI